MNRVLLLLLLFSMKSFAQESAHSATYDTLYFSSSYGKVSAEYADIKRIIYEEDSETDRYVFKEYDKDGKLTMSGVTKERNGRPDGMVAYYHENGVRKSEGYLEFRKKGIWKEWYQNGQLKETVEFGEDEARNFVAKLISFYDSLGNELVNQGAGLFKEYYQNNIHGQLKTKGRYHNYNRVGEWEGYHTDGQLYYQERYSEEGEYVKGTSYDLGEPF